MTSRLRVAVVGAHGQVGAALAVDATSRWDVRSFTRADFDITDQRAAARAIHDAAPDVVVNCTAFNDVDGAEDRPDVAFAVNAHAVETLARAADRAGAAFLHYGTDFVFDGIQTTPYAETDAANPQSVYAKSKHAGELAALSVPRGYVLRVASVFGHTPAAPPRGSIATIVSNIRHGKPVRAFEDRTVSPTLIADCVEATTRLLETGAPFGLYHCVSSGHTTWLELAKEAARQLDTEAEIVPVRVADVALRAPRPQHASLSNRKLTGLGIRIPTWQDALGKFIRNSDWMWEKGDGRREKGKEKGEG